MKLKNVSMENDQQRLLRPSNFVLLGDQVLIFLGMMSALFAHYRILSINLFPLTTIGYRVLLHGVIAVGAWIAFGMNKRVIRYFHNTDYLNLVLILFSIHVVSFSVGMLLPKKLNLSFEIFIISFFITSFYIVFSRLMISYLYHLYDSHNAINNAQKRLLIYGAGEVGVILKKSISANHENEFNLIGFIDDNRNRIGRYIQGVKVYDVDKELTDIIKKYNITDIFIAKKALTAEKKAKFLEETISLNVRIKEVPSIANLFNSKLNLDMLSAIDINDLMNRKPIDLYDEHVANNLQGKRVLVTGAAGSIGSEIVRKLAEHNAELITCVDFSESALYDLQQELLRNFKNVAFKFVLTDIRDENKMHHLFEVNRFDVIYHAAAYKHVPLMEQFPWEAVQTNVLSTCRVAKLALKFNAEKFVLISSDKAVNPTSIMGATKRLAEIIVQSFASSSKSTGFVVTRFGNVLGSNGSVVPLFKKQIQNGGPVTVTHPEMTRYFMTIPEACKLVLEASVMAEGGEVFVFDMGKPIKIIDLARNMIRLAGYVPDVDMPINFVGLRPGEKLYEDLFTDNEEMKETYNEKIMISKQKHFDFSEAEQIIYKLENLENFYDPKLYQMIIKDILPEYQGDNKQINIQVGQ